MSETYHPFGQDEIIRIRFKKWQDGRFHILEAECERNDVGDLGRFVMKSQGESRVFRNVASPMDDQIIPLHPVSNVEGESRLNIIRLRHTSQQAIEESESAISADLDEYIRSKILFRDKMSNAERYDFE